MGTSHVLQSQIKAETRQIREEVRPRAVPPEAGTCAASGFKRRIQRRSYRVYADRNEDETNWDL
jgi:hypothetical protein